MLVRKVYCAIKGKDAWKHVHPNFNHFDRLVTIMVAVEVLTKLPDLVASHPGSFAAAVVAGIALWAKVPVE